MFASAPAGTPFDEEVRMRRMLHWLVLVLASGVLISAAIVAVSLARGESLAQALRSTSLIHAQHRQDAHVVIVAYGIP